MPASDLLPSFYFRCFTTTFPSCKSLNPCSICWLILDLKVFCLVWGVILPLLHRCPESCLLSGSRWPRPFRVYGICPRCPILLPCLVPLCSESKACMPSDLAPRALAVSAYGQDFLLFFSGLRTGSSETMPASWLAVHRSQTFLVLLAYSCCACRLTPILVRLLQPSLHHYRVPSSLSDFFCGVGLFFAEGIRPAGEFFFCLGCTQNFWSSM